MKALASSAVGALPVWADIEPEPPLASKLTVKVGTICTEKMAPMAVKLEVEGLWVVVGA